VGKNLGQFHCDFAGEGHPMAVESIFLAKKVYCDVLVNDQGVETVHFRMKRVSHSVIERHVNRDFDGNVQENRQRTLQWQWEPAPKDKRFRTLGHQWTCVAYKKFQQAREGLLPGRNTNVAWHALELTPARYLPVPSALANMDHPPTIKAYAQTVATAVAHAQTVAADIISVRANIKHAHEDIWNQQIQEAKEAGERTVHGKRLRTNEEAQHNEDRTHAPHLRQARQQDTQRLTNAITHQQRTIRDHNTSTSHGVAQRQVVEMDEEEKSNRGEDESSTGALVNEQRIKGTAMSKKTIRSPTVAEMRNESRWRQIVREP
jgi:hypothetical protein